MLMVGKLLDVAAMIQPGAQMYIKDATGQDHMVEPGPALRMDLGDGLSEEHAEP